MKESYELTIVGSFSDEEDAAINLVDENWRDVSLSHNYLPHIFNSTTLCGDEYGLKGFSFFVPHEEHECWGTYPKDY